MKELILQDQRDGVLFLTLNRPEKRNALSEQMYRTLVDALRHASEEPAIRAVVLLGQPATFCSGNEVDSFIGVHTLAPDLPVLQFMDALADCSKPVIAGVDGLAIGIGATLLLHCDLVYATARTRLQFPFTRLGLCPEFGSSLLLQRIAGRAHAAEALLLGEAISAEKACQWGLINEIMPESALRDHVSNRANALAALPAEAVQASKRLLREAEAPELMAARKRELLVFNTLLGSESVQAGFRQFRDSRAARA